MTMKTKIMHTMLFIAIFIAMNSCSANIAKETESSTPTTAPVTNYTYNNSELEIMKLINDYRVRIGLNALQKNNYISYKCQEHNKYMIANHVLNHDGFSARSRNIMQLIGAKKVGENVARKQKTPEAVVKAWLESPRHKENIKGNFTHFGLSVSTDAATGDKYYTNIFVKI
jgi:uncharacterized protein YkwD